MEQGLLEAIASVLSVVLLRSGRSLDEDATAMSARCVTRLPALGGLGLSC